MISIRQTIKIVSSYNAGETDDEPGAEEQGNEKTLAHGEIQSKDYWNWNQDNEKVADDVDDAFY
jgi:hypothetical protein